MYRVEAREGGAPAVSELGVNFTKGGDLRTVSSGGGTERRAVGLPLMVEGGGEEGALSHPATQEGISGTHPEGMDPATFRRRMLNLV